MKRKIEFSKATLLPIIVLVLSVFNILINFNNLTLSIFLSIVGIIGVVLFYFRNNFSSKLIYLWILAQVLIIDPIFDLSQSNFTLGFKFGFGSHSLTISFLPLLLLGLIKVMESSNLIGKKITLLKFRDNEISDSLPISGTIINRLDFNTDKNWLLIELDDLLIYDGESISKVLIKNKEDKSIQLKAKNQIAHFRLVVDEINIESNDITNFPFIDWIRCV